MQFHRYDVVIVGAGGAGMRAAIESTQRARTAVLTKLYPTRSHTGAAQGGMCAALANVEDDNWEWHTFDTVKGGDYLVDQDAAEIMCKEAIDAVLDLEKMGLPFNRTPEGRIDQRRFGGHTRNHGEAAVRRACYAADRTGHMILQTLYQNCVKQGVEFFNEFYVLDVMLTDDPATGQQICTGAVAYELATGEIHVFHAKAVVFATGGAGKVFKTTSNAHTLTGDGMGVVLRKGLPLEDMEFYQFHPTGLAGLGILLTEGARGEGAILRNASGERFMERYAPTIKDLAPRDIVARSMVMEVLEGRGAGPHKDYVLLDCTHLGADVLETKLPDITEFARTYLGVDPVTEPVPVFPTAHYAMGGIPTNVWGEVLRDNVNVVPGMYAAGECACVSVHGSNRLGTNSLLDINVFGKRAGIAAAAYANSTEFVHDVTEESNPPSHYVESMVSGLLNSTGHERVADIRIALQASMDANAAVYRTEETLKTALHDVQGLKERYKQVSVHDKGKRYNTDLLEAVELGFLLDLAEVMVVGALTRKESRGGHAREDYPNRDDTNWMRHTMAYKMPSSEEGAGGHRHQARLQARRDDPLPADGAKVLMTATIPDTGIAPDTGHFAPLPDVPEGAIMVTVHIQRFNPELDDVPHKESYRIPALPTDRILNLLHYIKWYIDGSLTFRRSCAHGICGSDAMRINGRNRLGCKVLVKDVVTAKNTEITVEPIKGLPLEKDLIVDMEPFFEAFRAVKPFMITHGNEPTREWIQSQSDRDRFDDTTKCILCACCTTSCPVYWSEDAYVGPAAIVNAHRFIFRLA